MCIRDSTHTLQILVATVLFLTCDLLKITQHYTNMPSRCFLYLEHVPSIKQYAHHQSRSEYQLSVLLSLHYFHKLHCLFTIPLIFVLFTLLFNCNNLVLYTNSNTCFCSSLIYTLLNTMLEYD